MCAATLCGIVVLPKAFEKLLKADVFRGEDHPHHLGVTCQTWRTNRVDLIQIELHDVSTRDVSSAHPSLPAHSQSAQADNCCT